MFTISNKLKPTVAPGINNSEYNIHLKEQCLVIAQGNNI